MSSTNQLNNNPVWDLEVQNVLNINSFADSTAWEISEGNDGSLQFKRGGIVVFKILSSGSVSANIDRITDGSNTYIDTNDLTNNIVAYTNGSLALTLEDDQDVKIEEFLGIGTSPTVPLEIKKITDTEMTISESSTSNNNYMFTSNTGNLLLTDGVKYGIDNNSNYYIDQRESAKTIDFRFNTVNSMTISSAEVSVPKNFKVNGTTFFVDATSNEVGIGTSAPENLLHLRQTSAGSINYPLRLTNFSATNGSGSGIDFNAVDNSTTTGQIHNFRNGSGDYSLVLNSFTSGLSSNQLVLRSDNVGIGTSAPSTTLHVKTSGSNGITMETTTLNSTFLRLKNSTYTSTISSNFNDGSLILSPDSSEVMRIESSGMVGIGTSTPSTKLHLKDTTSSLSLLVESNADSTLALLVNSDTTDPYVRFAKNVGGNRSYAIGMDNSDSDKLKINTETSTTVSPSSGTNLMTIQTDGKVGIGTTIPQGDLHIGANIPTLYFGNANVPTRSTLTIRGQQGSGSSYVNRYLINNVSGSNSNAHTWYSDIGTSRMTLDNVGNLEATGWIRGGAVGQLVNSKYLKNSDISFTTGTFNSATPTEWFSYVYTPILTTSRIKLTVDCWCQVSGTGTDTWVVRLNESGSNFFLKEQDWVNSGGGGTRSGILFPLCAVFNNITSSNKTFQFQLQRSGDDTLTLDNTLAFSFIIEEIAN